MRLSRLLLPILCALAWPALLCADDAPPVGVRLLLSNSAPYVGEEVVLTLEVRYRQRPGGAMAVRWPRLDAGVSSELPPLLPRREESAEGSLLVESARMLLRPLSAGRFRLEGGIELQRRLLPAPPLTLRVRPLPAGGRPEGFAGAVGSAGMELLAAGDGSREVRLVLRGNAPLDAFARPLAELGRDERLIFLDESFSGSAGAMRERTFRYLYLPGAGRRGELAFRLPLFDPAAGGYRLLQAGVGEIAAPRRALYWGLLAALPCAPLLLLGLYLRQRRRRSLGRLLRKALGRPADGLSREAVAASLRLRGVRPATVEALASLWAAEDRARFAPGSCPAGSQGLAAQRRQAARQLANDVDKCRRIP